MENVQKQNTTNKKTYEIYKAIEKSMWDRYYINERIKIKYENKINHEHDNKLNILK